MKKHSMWVVLAVILVVEAIVYFVAVSPQAGDIEQKTTELKRATGKRGLERYVDMGGKIPCGKRNSRKDENRQVLQDEYNACLGFYRNPLDANGLKKWFPKLATAWQSSPTPAQFQSVYKDEFKELGKLCRQNGIAVSDREVVHVIELETGEKVEGLMVREDTKEIAVLVDGSERVLKKKLIKQIMRITDKYTAEEAALISGYQRFSQKPQPETEETIPDETGGAFWETSKFNEKNLRIAQKQYWIQKRFVDALIEARGKQLVYVSFYKELAGARAPREEKPQTSKNAIDEHFERVPVTVLVRMPYSSVATMLRSLNSSGVDIINMKLRSLKVMKPLLAEIRTNHFPIVESDIRLFQQLTNGVFPKILPPDNSVGVNFGTQPIQTKRTLPDQDELLSEPPVLVEFSYDVMDMKEPQEGGAK